MANFTGTGLFFPAFTGVFPVSGLFLGSYVTVTASPYDVLATDQAIDVNTTGGNITIRLPATPGGYRILFIARTSAGANTLTVDGNGNNINGAATYLIPVQYQAILIIFNGTEWRVF